MLRENWGLQFSSAYMQGSFDVFDPDCATNYWNIFSTFPEVHHMQEKNDRIL